MILTVENLQLKTGKLVRYQRWNMATGFTDTCQGRLAGAGYAKKCHNLPFVLIEEGASLRIYPIESIKEVEF